MLPIIWKFRWCVCGGGGGGGGGERLFVRRKVKPKCQSNLFNAR